MVKFQAFKTTFNSSHNAKKCISLINWFSSTHFLSNELKWLVLSVKGKDKWKYYRIYLDWSLKRLAMYVRLSHLCMREQSDRLSLLLMSSCSSGGLYLSIFVLSVLLGSSASLRCFGLGRTTLTGSYTNTRIWD